MSTRVRPHYLTEGSALDRRRLVELFYWAAKKLSLIDSSNIDSDEVTIALLEEDAFEEMYFGDVSGIIYKTPNWTGVLLPGSTVEIHNDDNGLELAIDYSIVVKAVNTDASYIYACACAGNTLLHASGHLVSVDQELCYISPDAPPDTTNSGLVIIQNDEITMSGSATVIADSGNQFIGVTVVCDSEFEITRSSCLVRRVVR